MRTISKAATLALGASAALAGSVALGAPAMAASTPIGVCGGGDYHVIDHENMGEGAITAITYLLWSNSAKTNCVVTFKVGSAVGDSVSVSARLQVQGQPAKVDGPKAYKYYAGPVKAAAGGKCVRFGGTYGELNFWSNYGHCG
jgi:hypothetical protein